MNNLFHRCTQLSRGHLYWKTDRNGIICIFQSGAQKLKALDDLYIDDEGEDDIQLQDEASGSGPTHRKSVTLFVQMTEIDNYGPFMWKQLLSSRSRNQKFAVNGTPKIDRIAPFMLLRNSISFFAQFQNSRSCQRCTRLVMFDRIVILVDGDGEKKRNKQKKTTELSTKSKKSVDSFLSGFQVLKFFTSKNIKQRSFLD